MSAAQDLLDKIDTYQQINGRSNEMVEHASAGWILAAAAAGDARRDIIVAALAWAQEARHSTIGIEDGDDTWGFILERVTDLLDDARSTLQEGSDFDSTEWAAQFVADERAAMAERHARSQQ